MIDCSRRAGSAIERKRDDPGQRKAGANDLMLLLAHREDTQGQIERLEQVFEMLGKRPQTMPCEAINGIVAGVTIEDFGESAAIDTGLVAAGQVVENYEMATAH